MPNSDNLVLVSVGTNKYNRVEVLQWFVNGDSNLYIVCDTVEQALKHAHKHGVPVILGSGCFVERIADVLAYSIGRWKTSDKEI